LWPRLAASRPQPIIGRALLLLAVNALVVATAAIALNDEFTFFADWTDLHGAIFGTHGGSTALAGGAAAKAAQPPTAPRPRPPPTALGRAAAAVRCDQRGSGVAIQRPRTRERAEGRGAG